MMRRFRHKKRGTEYELVGRAGMQIASDELVQHTANRDSAIIIAQALERKSYVVYRAIKDDTLWVRPESEFFDGRFVEMK